MGGWSNHLLLIWQVATANCLHSRRVRISKHWSCGRCARQYDACMSLRNEDADCTLRYPQPDRLRWWHIIWTVPGAATIYMSLQEHAHGFAVYDRLAWCQGLCTGCPVAGTTHGKALSQAGHVFHPAAGHFWSSTSCGCSSLDSSCRSHPRQCTAQAAVGAA